MTKLVAPLGVYMVRGNHDQLIDGLELVRQFQAAGLNLLINECIALEHAGCCIQIVGIDFHRRLAELEQMVALASRSSTGEFQFRFNRVIFS